MNSTYTMPDGKPVFPKNMYKWEAIGSHGPCHVSTGWMVKIVQLQCYAIGSQSYPRKTCSACPIVSNIILKEELNHRKERLPSHLILFTRITWTTLNSVLVKDKILSSADWSLYQVDRIVSKVKTVAKALCRKIIPRVGIPEALWSDNGSHLVNKVISRIGEIFKITLKNHCSYHPQSCSFRLYETNFTSKKKSKGQIICQTCLSSYRTKTTLK